MRILFVSHNFVRGNGQGRIQFEIVRHALSSAHHVTLIADRVDSDMVNAGATWLPVHQRPAKPNILGVRTFAGSADRLVRRIRRDFDVVVGGGYTLREPHDVNLCQFVHGAWIKSPVHVARLSRGPYAWYQATYTWANSVWETQAYRRSRFVVAPSQKIRDELTSIGVPAESIRVIYNGVDLQEFAPRSSATSTADERADLGLPVDGPLALFVGDIRTPRKNLDSVIKALADVPDLKLVVVGALAGSPFPALARQLGVAERVTFTDYRRDVGQIMRAVDLFVFPSRYEAGTLVLIEALATGLPVITARTAGGCEIIGNKAGTILDDPDDVPGLVKALRHWAGDADARRAASNAARRLAEQHSWAMMATHYMKLFAEAVATREADKLATSA